MRQRVEQREQMLRRIQSLPVEPRPELPDAAVGQVFHQIADPGEAVGVVLMDPVGAASADRIVRMVAQQRFPQIAEIVAVVQGVAAELFEQDVQRLETQFDQRFEVRVLPFQRQPGRQRPLQNVAGRAVPQFAGFAVQRDAMLRRERPHRFQITAEGGLADHIRRDPAVQLLQNRQQVLLRLQMIDAVHQQPVRCDRLGFLRRLHFAEKEQRQFRVFRKTLRIVVPAAHKGGQHRRTVGRTPFKLIGLRFPLPPVAAPEYAVVDAEAAENLRQLSDQSELVGRIAAPGARSELLRQRGSRQQIPHGGLAAGQEEVVLHIPRPDFQVARTDIPLQFRAAVWPDFQIILQTDGLRIQLEHILRILPVDLQQMIDQVDQPVAEHLERLVPLPVPVSM